MSVFFSVIMLKKKKVPFFYMYSHFVNPCIWKGFMAIFKFAKINPFFDFILLSFIPNDNNVQYIICLPQVIVFNEQRNNFIFRQI